MSYRRYREWEPYVYKVHYSMGGRTLCSAWKTRGKKKPIITVNKSEVTCKTCLKKISKGGHIIDHFEGELFTI